MTDYRTWLDARGVARGPWVVRDSGGDPEGEDPKGLSAQHRRAASRRRGIAQKVDSNAE